MRIAPAIQITEPNWNSGARGWRTPARLVLRAKTALLAAEGHDNQSIAVALDTSRQRWASGGNALPPSACPASAQDAPTRRAAPKARQTRTARIL